MKPLVRLNDVAFTYRERAGFFSFRDIKVIKNLSLEVFQGEAVGILGKNGVGKSTILKLIAGIITPDHGTIEHGDSSISLLTLGSGFDGRLSGRFNVFLSGMLLGFSKLEISRRMDAIIEFADLGEAIDRPVRSYSSGMRARLGFSVANVLEPDLLLIDEVLGVGDADFRVKSRLAMRAKIDAGQTIVLVSHNGNAIRRLCTRAIWIEDGRMKEAGNVEDVVSSYERSTGS